MTDRPILFSAPMVRALLDGRKTQTRRVLASMRTFALPDSPAYTLKGADLQRAMLDIADLRCVEGTAWTWTARAFEYQAPAARTHWNAHIRFAKGDRLWVREAWRCNGWASDVATIFYRASEGDGYTAMCEQWPVAYHKPLRVEAKWSPSLHMPRWASRLTLTVTDVRIQRLQEITPADAIAEGIWAPANSMTIDCATRDPRDDFQALWGSINGADSWAANPWIVAITFTVERRNIDATDGAAEV